MPIGTITPLRSNPSSFSFVMEPEHHARLEPPSQTEETPSHFVMAPQLVTHTGTKNNDLDSDSDSSGSGEDESSSDEESSDSDVDAVVEDMFVPASTTTMDQTRNQSSLITSTADPDTETMTTVNNATISTSTPAIGNNSMKRLRNMFAAVKPPDTIPNTNTTPMQLIEAITPVTPLPSNTDGKTIARQQPQATVTVTSDIKNTPAALQLPRKSNTKRVTSVSSQLDVKKSSLSEESSSDSEGEESGEVTNSDSEEDEVAKPKPPKQAKWDKAPTMAAPETDKLQLLCSIPRQYMRTAHNPVSTPKSPVSEMSSIITVTALCNIHEIIF